MHKPVWWGQKHKRVHTRHGHGNLVGLLAKPIFSPVVVASSQQSSSSCLIISFLLGHHYRFAGRGLATAPFIHLYIGENLSLEPPCSSPGHIIIWNIYKLSSWDSSTSMGWHATSYAFAPHHTGLCKHTVLIPLSYKAYDAVFELE